MTLSRFNETLHSIRQRLMAPPPPAAQPDPYAHLPSAKRVYRKACRAKALEIARKHGVASAVEVLSR